MSRLTQTDREAVEAFSNFLSWGEVPAIASTGRPKYKRRAVPPAWWAYSFGETRWCPPKGEL
jgi:hypothetical protein